MWGVGGMGVVDVEGVGMRGETRRAVEAGPARGWSQGRPGGTLEEGWVERRRELRGCGRRGSLPARMTYSSH